MNILDEITVDFDLDSKILCETPAKLKLRDKTLKGIYFNLNDEQSTIPALMLAKKKKKGKKKEKVEEKVVEGVKEEIPQEEVVQEVEEKEYSGVDISEMDMAEVNEDFDATRKLRVSEERKEIFSVVGQELINTISEAADISLNENVNEEVNEDEVVVEAVSVEEIPETEEVVSEVEITSEEAPVEEEPELPVEEQEYSSDEEVVETTEEYNIEEPVVEVNEEVNVEENVEDEQQVVQNEDVEVPVAEEMVIEEPEFNIEQGEEGIVANVEEVAVPVVEEVNENEIPNVEETFVNSPVLEQAMENEYFKKNLEVIQETRNLELQDKELGDLLAMDIEKRQDAINTSSELDQKHIEHQEKIVELQNYFDRLVAQQREDNEKRRENIQASIDSKNAERLRVQEETSQYEEMNSQKAKLIEEDENEIMKYEQLIQSLQALQGDNSYEEENTYSKVA